MKVAIVYDRANKWGGAERVLLSLQKIFPYAHLYTSVLNRKKAFWVKKFHRVETSFLQNFPFSSNHEIYATLMPLAFENLSFDNYDLVISVTSEAAKGIITKPKTKHICYCLTPTRYLWSGYETYFKNSLLRFFSKPIISYLRNWDKIAAQRPDFYFAVSYEVQKRIKKYYGRDSKVLYPPLNLNGNNTKTRKGKYFLIVSRLVSYKRIDLAVKACNKLSIPLKIVGTGSQERYLKMISKKNIEFLGFVSDSQLFSLYAGCKALIFPGVEDFGATMIEAQSFGKPVIAFKGGGALEVVKEKTGEFFDQQNVQSLVNLLEKWDDKRYNTSLCIENSKRFSFSMFKQEIEDIIRTP